MVPRPRINVLAVSRLPIYTQLCLEEALLRATKDNWLIVNDGAFSPAIVLGISGQVLSTSRVPRHGRPDLTCGPRSSLSWAGLCA